MARIPKLKEGDVVEFTWRDACTSSQMCKAEEYDPVCVLHSVGTYIKRSRGYFVTATQYDDFAIGDRDYRFFHSTPLTDLIKVTKLRGGKR